jgi:hypothetical protein
MDIDVGRALETDFVHLRDETGEQELEYLRRTRAFVENEMLPVIGGLLGARRVPLGPRAPDGRA